MNRKVGTIQVYEVASGIDVSCMAMRFVKKGKEWVQDYTNRAKRVNAQNKKKRVVRTLPIYDEAFYSNGKSPVSFDQWIKSIVSDIKGMRNPVNGIDFNVTSYVECRRNYFEE